MMVMVLVTVVVIVIPQLLLILTSFSGQLHLALLHLAVPRGNPRVVRQLRTDRYLHSAFRRRPIHHVDRDVKRVTDRHVIDDVKTERDVIVCLAVNVLVGAAAEFVRELHGASFRGGSWKMSRNRSVVG